MVVSRDESILLFFLLICFQAFLKKSTNYAKESTPLRSHYDPHFSLNYCSKLDTVTVNTHYTNYA